jgi:hypothetical protein
MNSLINLKKVSLVAIADLAESLGGLKKAARVVWGCIIKLFCREILRKLNKGLYKYSDCLDNCFYNNTRLFRRLNTHAAAKCHPAASWQLRLQLHLSVSPVFVNKKSQWKKKIRHRGSATTTTTTTTLLSALAFSGSRLPSQMAWRNIERSSKLMWLAARTTVHQKPRRASAARHVRCRTRRCA